MPLRTATLALLALATPVLAQTAAPAELPYDRGYDKPSARADAVNAVEAPETARLNTAADVAATGAALSAEAQYESDRLSYMSALAAHDRAIDRSDARYARQQVAYADAMRAWRDQVQACKTGRRRACDAPPPNVADYY